LLREADDAGGGVSTTRRLEDQAQVDIGALVLTVWNKVQDEIDRRLADGLVAAVPWPRVDGASIEREQAADYLHACRDWLEADAARQAQAFSPARWLWYLRRLPSEVLAGELPSTLVYDQALAETLTAGSTRVHGRLGGNLQEFHYPYDVSIIRRVARLCATARAVSSIHGLLRRVGKGAKLRRDRGGDVYVGVGELVATVEEPEAVTQAIALYDRRKTTPFLTRTGTRVADINPDTQTNNDNRSLLFGVTALDDWHWVPALVGGDSTEGVLPKLVEVKARYMPIMLSLEPLGTLYQAVSAAAGAGTWDPSLAPLLYLLHTVEVLLLQTRVNFVNLTRYGYLVYGRRYLESALEAVVPGMRPVIASLLPGATPTSGSEVLAELRGLPDLQGRAWPLRLALIVR
jgi:hypothetical protein